MDTDGPRGSRNPDRNPHAQGMVFVTRGGDEKAYPRGRGPGASSRGGKHGRRATPRAVTWRLGHLGRCISEVSRPLWGSGVVQEAERHGQVSTDRPIGQEHHTRTRERRAGDAQGRKKVRASE